MCNLYSITKTRDELVGLFDVRRDPILDLLNFSAIYPDRLAPVVRLDEDGSHEMSLMRWGLPPPPKVGTRPVTNVRSDGSHEMSLMRWGLPPPPKVGTRPVTNVRSVNSSFWRHWLKPEFRCLVPASLLRVDR